MNKERLVSLLNEALNIASSGVSVPSAGVVSVYDLQPMGYYRLGEVEVFRSKLAALNGNHLAQRWAKESPHWFMVQDGENYIQMTPEQIGLQDFNCGNARFTLAIWGQTQSSSNLDDPMWRTWLPAIVRLAEGNDNPIVDKDGSIVVAVPDTSYSRGGTQILKANPEIKDMAGVVARAYEYYYARNHVSFGDTSTDPYHS